MRINNLKSLAGVVNNGVENGYSYVTQQQLQSCLSGMGQSGILSCYVKLNNDGKIDMNLIPNISVSKVHVYTESDILSGMSAQDRLDALQNKADCFQLITKFLRPRDQQFNVGQLVLMKDTQQYYNMQGTYIITKVQGSGQDKIVSVDDFIFGTQKYAAGSGQMVPGGGGKNIDVNINTMIDPEKKRFADTFWHKANYFIPSGQNQKLIFMFDGVKYVNQALLSTTINYFDDWFNYLQSQINQLSGQINNNPQ